MLVLLLFPPLLEAREVRHVKEVDAFIEHMVRAHGFDKVALDALFAKVQRCEPAIRLVSPAPSSAPPMDWQVYRSRFVNRVRIMGGVEYWKKHRQTLSRASRQFAVPPEIIVAIIGVETLYGRHTGSYRVLDALSTLAFDYPDAPNRKDRMAFFRGELENALVFSRRSGIDPLSLYGSYAGAIGLPQFMPGSILKYGIDFDGDGRIDLMHSAPDAIGSVANFLSMHGWRKGEPVVLAASVRSDGWKSLPGGLSARFSLKKLEASGVFPAENAPGLSFGLIDLQNGNRPSEYWLGTDNFFAITQYNRSYYYAMSVVDLSQALKKALQKGLTSSNTSGSCLVSRNCGNND